MTGEHWAETYRLPALGLGREESGCSHCEFARVTDKCFQGQDLGCTCEKELAWNCVRFCPRGATWGHWSPKNLCGIDHVMCCCCCCCYVTSVVSDSVHPHRRQPTRLPHPWDSPSKNTGVGCHFLLPDQGSNLFPLQWKHGVLTPGWPGNSLQKFEVVKRSELERISLKTENGKDK